MKSLILIMITSSLISINFALNAYTDDPHPHGASFDLDCALCHSTDSWKIDAEELSFDHTTTGYPLTGMHHSLHCTLCHSSLKFSHVGILCADCHIDIHRGELGIDCERCHTAYGWENRSEHYDLHATTRFPLIGAHAHLDCQACHSDEQRREFIDLPIKCISCHREDFQETSEPNHKKASFSLRCYECHILDAVLWNEVVYEHTVTFPLEGGHSNINCTDCHVHQYAGQATGCISCHQEDYASADDPDHLAFGFPTVCEACHTVFSWSEAEFDHFTRSGFQLNGQHMNISCNGCHINNQLAGLPQTCIGCHLADFQSVEDPDHVAGSFTQNCLECHNEEHWVPSEFDHNNTPFPLTGAHINITCSSCHESGQFSGLPADCWSCHENDYREVNDPDHVAGNFDQDCLVCHSTTAWEPADFDHSVTGFVLEGAHRSAECAQCHIEGYSGTPNECYPCHETAYAATADPAHQTAQFPVTCEDCHTVSAWTPSTFDHDGLYFPIYTGKHRNEWRSCSDCHVQVSNYAIFECIDCHEHDNQTDLNEKHKEVQDYVYESQACYECHPAGIAEGDLNVW